jgi:hypothetical protein
MHLPSVLPRKILMTSVIISGFFGIITPAVAGNSGSRSYLVGLPEISYDQCMSQARKAVESVSSDEIRHEGNGFHGNYSPSISVNIMCVEVGSSSAAKMETFFSGYEQKPIALQALERMKSVFYSN